MGRVDRGEVEEEARIVSKVDAWANFDSPATVSSVISMGASASDWVTKSLARLLFVLEHSVEWFLEELISPPRF